MKICIWGIGYVGAVTSACLAESGHDIIAIDTNPDKILCLNEGRSPIVEKDLGNLLSRNVGLGRIRATSDAHYAMAQCEMSLVCVGTPSDDEGRIDYRYIEQVTTQIAELLRHIDNYHIIVMRSTILPGTMERIVIPLLEERSGKRAGQDFGVGYNPEFLREGCAVEDFFNPTQIVVGGLNAKDCDHILSLYEGLDAPRSVVPIKVAEAVKYVSNIWRAHKISFANEMGNILQASGVDVSAVMDVFKQDTEINMGPAFLNPGFAFGGSCLPKDIRAMRCNAHSHDVHTPLLDAVLETNHNQIRKAVCLIEDLKPKRILLLGLTFKPHTDDLRESPYVALARELLYKDIGLDIVDQNIKSDTHGITAAHLNLYAELMRRIILAEEAKKNKYDVIVLGHAISDYKELIKAMPPQTKTIALSYPGSDNVSWQGLSW